MIPPDFDNGGNKKKDDGDNVGTTRVKVKGWPGYVRAGVYVIEKRVRGVKFHVSTRATTLRGAMKQLERFDADPTKYGKVDAAPADVVLDTTMLAEFTEWHRKEVTREWANNVHNCLVDWADHFAGKDLRTLDLIRDVKPHLRGRGQIPHRVKSIKVLFGWLRTEKGLVTRAEDVTADLVAPPPKARQQTGESKAVPWETVSAVAAHLSPHIRDVLELLSSTGWHVSDARRFAKWGTIRDRVASDPPDVIVVLGTKLKGPQGGRAHFTAISHEEHVAAAKRVRELGSIPNPKRLNIHMTRAARAAGVAPFQLGQLRHSVATWLRQAGIADEASSQFLGHLSPATTRKFYIDGQVAQRVLPRTALRVVGK